MHNYKLGDKVRHEMDQAPFEVIGVRKDTVEIEGDFSGGTHNVTQSDWVPVEEVELFYPQSAIPNRLTADELKNRYEHHLTVGELRKELEKSSLPDDAKVLVQRIEDRYYSKSGGWGLYLKEGCHYHSLISRNKDMKEEIARRERGEESEYPGIEDPIKFIFEDQETLDGAKEQYHPIWGVVKYKDEEFLFFDLHY